MHRVQVWIMAAFAVCALGVHAQAQTAGSTKFEIAVVRPANPGSDHNGRTDNTPDQFRAYGWSVKRIIAQAYGLKEVQVNGGPAWGGTDLYDIDARIDVETAAELKPLDYMTREERYRPMLQTLLADRFGLKVRMEDKTLSVYVLSVAKGGSKLTETPPGGNLPEGIIQQRVMNGNMEMSAKNLPASFLAEMLSGFAGGHDFVSLNETGLTGHYDFTLSVAAPQSPGVPGGDAFGAIEDQLGLQLTIQKRAVPTVTVENLERPTEN